jgi:hypothetical protein
MSRYGSFDYDKSEQLITVGHNKARKALETLEASASPLPRKA